MKTTHRWHHGVFNRYLDKSDTKFTASAIQESCAVQIHDQLDPAGQRDYATQVTGLFWARVYANFKCFGTLASSSLQITLGARFWNSISDSNYLRLVDSLPRTNKNIHQSHGWYRMALKDSFTPSIKNHCFATLVLLSLLCCWNKQPHSPTCGRNQTWNYWLNRWEQ